MQSPYKSNTPKKRQMISNDVKKPQKTSKDTNEKDKPVFIILNTEKNLKGGNPNDDKPTQGKHHIEQAFFPISGCV